MNKIILFLGFVIVFGAGVVLLGQLYKVEPDSKTTNNDATQVEVVQNFWDDALENKDVKKYITQTPLEYFNEKPRCSSENKKISVKSEERLQSVNIIPKDKFAEDLIKTALMIGEGHFKLLNIKEYRNWEKEAIVEVTYRAMKELDYREKRYFFMIKTDDGWKTFLDDPVLTFSNQEYAKHQCSQ